MRYLRQQAKGQKFSLKENITNLEIDFSGTHKHLGSYFVCGTIPGKAMIYSEHAKLFFVLGSGIDGDEVTFDCGHIDLDNEDRFDLISTAILSSLQAMSCIASVVSHTKSSIVVKIVRVVSE